MKLARLPSWDWRFEAANCDLMMTPIGFCRPVTKAMMKNRANITAMGSARLLSLFAMSEWVYASGRLLRPVCRFCIGTLLRGQVFSPLPERARKERRLLRPAEGGLPFSAFAAVGPVRPVRTVPENGRHILCRTRPSSALFAVFPPGPFSGEGFLPRKLQYRGYCLTLFTSPAVPARWYCFRSVGRNGMQKHGLHGGL